MFLKWFFGPLGAELLWEEQPAVPLLHTDGGESPDGAVKIIRLL